MRIFMLACVALLVAAVTPAHAGLLCTIVVDARDGTVVFEQGKKCGERVTPASTFKIALAIMGYDAGFLADAHSPVLAFRQGDPDWGGDAWKRPVDPAAWMRHSVVWYSQRIARELGARRMSDYAAGFGYGNADFSGDPGKDNGLDRAWISSSLRISPREQVAFLRRFVRGDLPVAAAAIARTEAIVEGAEAAGWRLRGKTGSAYPRRPDGAFDRARPWGWYVGWAEKGGRRLVFAHLVQDERRETVSGGLRARSALLASWPDMVARLAAK